MAHFKLSALLIAFCLLLFTGCSSQSSGASTAARADQSAASAAEAGSQPQTFKAAASSRLDYALTGTIRVEQKADLYGTSKGRIALALIICKLDNSKSLSDLAQKDAAALFELLRETAIQKSVTLETIDKQYDVTDILASEGIHENIQANNVTSAASDSSRPGDVSSSSEASPAGSSSSANLYAWIPKFESAINSK